MKIITLTLNPAFDVHCYVEHFEPYHENLAEITQHEAGGKGVNISRALTMNNVNNLALVVLGEKNGDSFRRALDADGMEYLEITVPGRIRENITLHTKAADETRISFSDFNADASLLSRAKDAILPLIYGECIITFTGRVPSGIDMASVKDFLRELQARGAKLVIDSRSFSKADLLEMKPWLIKPNQEEISEYLGIKVETLDDTVTAAKELNRRGITNVMISLGSKGALLACADGCYVATPPKIEAISTIGAGDSSIAGFLAAAKDGADAALMLKTAVAYGSAACMSAGTRPPMPDDVASVLTDVCVKRI